MKKILFASIPLVLIAFVIAWKGWMMGPGIDEVGSGESGKILVATSFYPLHFFASRVGGDRAVVFNVTPAGAEPHDYEPTPKDMADIDRSRLIVVNGGGFEPWGDRIMSMVDATGTRVVVATEGILPEKMDNGGESPVDPHVWLSPALANSMVQNILRGYEAVDPSNADEYRVNARMLQSELSDLDSEYRERLADCERRDIVTSHSAFKYLASSYGLRQIPIAGLSPDAEPSPRELRDIAEFAKSVEVRYIFFESLVSPKLAETLAKEIGAGTLVLNPLEGLSPDEATAGSDYFSEMRSNLTHLRQALSCTE